MTLLRLLIPALMIALLGRGALALDTQAREAILIDITSGTVLFEKNPDERMPPSSMSKIMTMYMVFEALEEGRLTLTDELPVSERAWRMGGSKMFVDINTRVPVEALIQGVIVQSGNDACIVFAEALAGSEEAFAEQMTERAIELGLTGSHFANSTGWPDDSHYMTARDLALLAERLIADFPQYYHYYAQLEFTYHDILQHNRNPLLRRGIDGVDGLKTGHTEAAGYGLTASAMRDGRRLLLVVNGLPSESARAEESERLLEWGFREFETLELFQAGEPVTTARTWYGSPEELPLVLAEDLALTIPRSERDQLRIFARVAEPLSVPIAAGQPVATLVLTTPSGPAREVPLLAGTEVEHQGFFSRIGSSIGHLVLGD